MPYLPMSCTLRSLTFLTCHVKPVDLRWMQRNTPDCIMLGKPSISEEHLCRRTHTCYSVRLPSSSCSPHTERTIRQRDIPPYGCARARRTRARPFAALYSISAISFFTWLGMQNLLAVDEHKFRSGESKVCSKMSQCCLHCCRTLPRHRKPMQFQKCARHITATHCQCSFSK